MSVIQLSARQIRALKGCPNCDSKKIKLTSIDIHDHPIPQFRKQHFYECDDCGYWTGILDKYLWYPPPLPNSKVKETEK